MSTGFQKIVSRFLVYRVVSRFSFYVPVFVVALLAAGFSFQAVGGILFVYGLATMLFGGQARNSLVRRGPAATIAIGEAFKLVSNALIGFVLFGAISNRADVALAILLAAQVVGGIGYCFAAVGDGSYLAQAATALNAPGESQARAQARSSSYMFMSFLAAGCVGAVAFQVMPALPFFMTSIANLAASAIAFTGLRLQVPARADARSSAGNTSDRLTLATYTDLLGYSFMRAMVLTLQLLILPVWFFLDLGIDVAFFGVLFGLYTFAGFLGGRFYPLLAERVSQQSAVTIVLGTTLVSMLAISLGSLAWITLLAPVGMFCAAGMLRPAFLPALAHARVTSGGTLNAVPRAEQLFGALSAIAYLACALAFEQGYRPQQLVLGATALVALLLVLRSVLTLPRSRALGQPETID